MSAADITEEQVRARIDGMDEETQKRVVCALAGHSRIQTAFFGYFYCGRCGEQVGDTLASIYPGAAKAVVVGHDCDTCRKNAETLTWRDTLLTPDPFPKAEGAAA